MILKTQYIKEKSRETRLHQNEKVLFCDRENEKTNYRLGENICKSNILQNGYFGRYILVTAIAFQTNCEVIWAYPFVTKTPVGTKSLFRASSDQRYKFWENFHTSQATKSIFDSHSQAMLSLISR